MANFPLFEKVLSGYVAEFGNADPKDLYALTVSTIGTQHLDAEAGPLYIAKLFKHRPDVADACEDLVMFNREVISWKIGFHSWSRGLHRWLDN